VGLASEAPSGRWGAEQVNRRPTASATMNDVGWTGAGGVATVQSPSTSAGPAGKHQVARANTTSAIRAGHGQDPDEQA